MNKKNNSLKLFFIVSSLFLSFCCSLQLSYADFYVIAGGGRMAGTEIKSLPYTISTPGFYYITKNLWSPPETHGLTIEADNVTLDLMGFSIGLLALPGVPAGYDGIHMNGRTNVEIRNGTVTGFHRHGIHEASQTGVGHRIINVRLVKNRSNGIKLVGSNNLIEDCTVLSNSNQGIGVGHGSLVTGNIVYSNRNEGIYSHGRSTLVMGSGSTITGNTIYGNGSHGIDVAHGSTITGNTIYGNGSHGIAFYNGGTAITGNTAYGNGSSGIYALDYTPGSIVSGNTAYDNDSNGILAGSGSKVTGNTASYNSLIGIWASTGSTITGNTANVNYTGITGGGLLDQNTAQYNYSSNYEMYLDSRIGINSGWTGW